MNTFFNPDPNPSHFNRHDQWRDIEFKDAEPFNILKAGLSAVCFILCLVFIMVLL